MTENKIARRLPPCNRKVGACGKVGAAKSGAVKLERAVKQAADGRRFFLS